MNVLQPSLLKLATSTGLLSERQIRLVGGVLAVIDRDESLLALAELMARDSLWETAGAVADALHHFEQGGAWQRLKRGGRQPKSEMERLLCTVLNVSIGGSQKSIWRVLRGYRDKPTMDKPLSMTG